MGADAYIVAEYIQSPDIMEAIDGEMGIFRHFSSREYDLTQPSGRRCHAG